MTTGRDEDGDDDDDDVDNMDEDEDEDDDDDDDDDDFFTAAMRNLRPRTMAHCMCFKKRGAFPGNAACAASNLLVGSPCCSNVLPDT